MKAQTPLEAMQTAAWHLRMQLAGQSSYSGTPGKIDKGWAELLLERIETEGFRLVQVLDEQHNHAIAMETRRADTPKSESVAKP